MVDMHDWCMQVYPRTCRMRGISFYEINVLRAQWDIASTFQRYVMSVYDPVAMCLNPSRVDHKCKCECVYL